MIYIYEFRTDKEITDCVNCPLSIWRGGWASDSTVLWCATLNKAVDYAGVNKFCPLEGE